MDQPGSAVRLVLRLTWPVLIQQYLVLAVELSDFFLAGWFPPPDPSQHVAYQAAQTTAGYLAWLITCFTVFVTVGSTALVARLVGAHDHRGAVHATGQSITLALCVGLVGTVAGLVWVEDLVRLLGLGGDAAVFGALYLRPSSLSSAFRWSRRRALLVWSGPATRARACSFAAAWRSSTCRWPGGCSISSASRGLPWGRH